MVKKPTALAAPAAPSSNWKALKSALNPSAAPVAGAKRKRSEGLNSKGKEKARTKEEEAEELARAKGAESKGKRKELPIMELLEGKTEKWQEEVGQYLAIDCEMVGVGPEGIESALARVSIVNFHGAVILDQFVRPREKVTDYRTWVSGVREEDLRSAPSFAEVQKEVSDLIKERILIGHAISNDTQVLLLSHPRHLTRDTAKYAPLQGLAKTKRPGLKTLAKLVLDVDIQSGEHSSVDDARATMAIYRSQKAAWEDALRTHNKKPLLVTSSTPALQRLADNLDQPISGVKKSSKPKTLGLAATLRHARSEAAAEAAADAELGDDEVEEHKAKKARREADGDLILGFDFEPKRVAAVEEPVVVVKAKAKAKDGEGKARRVAGRAFKGDREKRPESKADWWE